MGVMSVRAFNASVSKAIAMVEAGETIEITKRGKVVAELRPKRPVRDAAWMKAREEMLTIMGRGIDLGGGPITPEDKYGDAVL